MKIKKNIFLTILILFYTSTISAQNLLNYETQIIELNFSPENGAIFNVNKGRFVFAKSVPSSGGGIFAAQQAGINPIAFELDNNIPLGSIYSKGIIGSTDFAKIVQIISDGLNKSGYSLKSTLVSSFFYSP